VCNSGGDLLIEDDIVQVERKEKKNKKKYCIRIQCLNCVWFFVSSYHCSNIKHSE